MCHLNAQVRQLPQKVCIETGSQGGLWAPPEAVLGTTLSHPHLVHGFKYAVSMNPGDRQSDGGGLPLCVCAQGNGE